MLHWPNEYIFLYCYAIIEINTVFYSCMVTDYDIIFDKTMRAYIDIAANRGTFKYHCELPNP